MNNNTALFAQAEQALAAAGIGFSVIAQVIDIGTEFTFDDAMVPVAA